MRTGINADSFNDGLAIANSTFQNSGTGVSIRCPDPSSVSNITSIHDNTFTNVDTDFNLQNDTTPINFDLTATNNTTSGTSTGTVLARHGGRRHQGHRRRRPSSSVTPATTSAHQAATRCRRYHQGQRRAPTRSTTRVDGEIPARSRSTLQRGPRPTRSAIRTR